MLEAISKRKNAAKILMQWNYQSLAQGEQEGNQKGDALKKFRWVSKGGMKKKFGDFKLKRLISFLFCFCKYAC